MYVTLVFVILYEWLSGMLDGMVAVWYAGWNGGCLVCWLEW